MDAPTVPGQSGPARPDGMSGVPTRAGTAGRTGGRSEDEERPTLEEARSGG